MASWRLCRNKMDEETLDMIYSLQKQIKKLQADLEVVGGESAKLARWVLNSYVSTASHINTTYTVLLNKNLVTREEISKMHTNEINKYCIMAEEITEVDNGNRQRKDD